MPRLKITRFAAQAECHYQATQQGNARTANRAYAQIVRAKDRPSRRRAFGGTRPRCFATNTPPCGYGRRVICYSARRLPSKPKLF